MGKFTSVSSFFLVVFIYSNSFAQTESTFTPTLKVKALVHSRYELSLTDSIDVQNKFNATPVQSNFRMRRVELRTDIKLNDKMSAVIRLQIPELKGSNIGRTLELAYIDYKFKDQFQIRAGQFKLPYELDELTSHEDLRMIDRGPTSSLFVSNNLASYQPGLMVFGNLLKDKMQINYFLAYVNGSNRAVSYDDNNQKNVVARIEFFPIKWFRIGVNGQSIQLLDNSGNSIGADLQVKKKITEKTEMILEGEYIQGTNVNSFSADTTGADIQDFIMGGYFGQALFKINIEKIWCKTFEVGAKYENTDPLVSTDLNAFSTITGNVGFTFLPENAARLQLNIVHTNWETPLSTTIDAANMLIIQFQLKI